MFEHALRQTFLSYRRTCATVRDAEMPTGLRELRPNERPLTPRAAIRGLDRVLLHPPCALRHRLDGAGLHREQSTGGAEAGRYV
jgi:hypothetical protein